MAIVIQSESWGETQRPARGQVPCDDGRKVVRRVFEAEAVTIAETSIHFDSCNKILATETASRGGCFHRQRAARSEGVSEFPGMI